MSGNFVFATKYTTLEDVINVMMTFKDGDLEKVQIQYGNEKICMSSDMFFAVMGSDAHNLYEKAAEAQQNERLQS